MAITPVEADDTGLGLSRPPKTVQHSRDVLGLMWPLLFEAGRESVRLTATTGIWSVQAV
jgi:hypothetical protein